MSNGQEDKSMGRQQGGGSYIDGWSRSEIYDFSNDTAETYLEKNKLLNSGAYFNKDNLLGLTGEMPTADHLIVSGIELKKMKDKVEALEEVLQAKKTELDTIHKTLTESWQGFAGECFKYNMAQTIERVNLLIQRSNEMAELLATAASRYGSAYEETERAVMQARGGSE